MANLPVGEERRDLSLTDAGVSVTPTEGQEQGRFNGYAAVFNSRTAIGNPLTWGFYEELAPGAFSKTIAEGDQRFLIDHNSYYVVSRVSGGTLSLAQDARGLPVDSALDTDLSYVGDLKANLRNGNLTGMSFGFNVPSGKDDWSTETIETKDGQSVDVEVRRIREVQLHEVSAVTFPAYEETSAGLRYSLIPAIRSRGDRDAVARIVRFRPELGDVLGYEPAWHLPPVAARAQLRPDRIEDFDDAGDDRADDPKKPYGDVTYADPGYQKDGKKRYPLDTAAHVKAAWSYINMPKNAGMYTSAQVASIKSKIKAAAKKFNIDIADDKKSSDEPGETTQTFDEAVRAAIKEFMELDEGEPTQTNASEPAASTRNAPSDRELEKQRVHARRVQLAAVFASVK